MSLKWNPQNSVDLASKLKKLCKHRALNANQIVSRQKMVFAPALQKDLIAALLPLNLHLLEPQQSRQHQQPRPRKGFCVQTLLNQRLAGHHPVIEKLQLLQHLSRNVKCA